ncbi:MAG TPA: CAP domain-containing protein [Thermoleophilaceae bacterium]
MRVGGSAHARLIRRSAGAALLATAALALGSASPAAADPACPGSDLQPTAGNLDQVEAATLCLINIQRAQFGLGALTANSVLQAAALQHSQDMVKNNFFSHDSSSGEDFEDRILRFKYAPTNTQWVAGENIAWGTLSLSTPDSIVVSWMNSPEHRANILNKQYLELGVGIEPSTPSGDPTGATYTADFGARASGPPVAAKRPKSKAHRHGKKHVRHHAKHKKHRKHGGCSSTRNSAVSLC